MHTASISISEFKAKCLEIVREVQEDDVAYVITKHGKPVAHVQPVPRSDQDDVNPLRDSILGEGDLISPIGSAWDALDACETEASP